MGKMSISEFVGVWTYGDHSDIPETYLTELKNLRPIHGKLEKTYGFGTKVATAQSGGGGLATYIHDNITSATNGQDDYLYIMPSIAIDGVTLYAYNSTTQAWVNITSFANFSLAETFYHRTDNFPHPVVQSGDIIRILPGNQYEISGNNCDGIWIDYISRSFFDGLYTSSDYTAKFFGYSTDISKPALTIVQPSSDQYMATAPFDDNDTLYYKMSYIYDGVQESLLSDNTVMVDISTSVNWLNAYFDITKSSHNKRITAIKLYRAHVYFGPYQHISTIDLLRASTKVETDASAGKNGSYYAYIPALAEGLTSEYSFDAGKTYCLSVNGTIINIENPGAGYHTLLQYETSPQKTITTDEWDVGWELFGDDVSVASGATGCYTGINTIITNDSLDIGKYVAGVIAYDTSRAYTRMVDKSVGYAVHTTTDIDGANSTGAYRLMSPINGLYDFIDDTPSAGDVRCYFYDNGIGDHAEHPLEGEVSVKINGNFARVIGGRLWQGDIILDPDDTAEVHTDWVSYSELGQLDVNPVSNVIRVYDREGGAIMGIQEVYGNPVILKKQGIFTYNTKSYPSDPTQWTMSESAHNIGNVAANGSIVAKDALFVCYTDGIYRLYPNNLAETDMTPTQKLRVSEAINDTYMALTDAQKAAIITWYDNTKEEVTFKLNTEYWAFNTITEQWREITTAAGATYVGYDQNGKAMMYYSTDGKIYSPTETEPVAADMVSKEFVLSNERDELLRKVTVQYKSGAALTLSVYEEGDVASGSIQPGVTYYNNGYTSVTYNGTAYTTTQTFTGVAGVHTYTTVGTGTVQIRTNKTLPASSSVYSTYETYPRYRGKTAKIRIYESAASSTTVEIKRIDLETED